MVKEGAPLYQIEKGLFEAAVKQAEGALERSKAAKVLTVDPVASAPKNCWPSNPAPSVARDQALAADQQAQGADPERRGQSRTPPRSTSATPRSARRSPARSAAPTSPRAMSSARTAAPLTVIVSQDPMYVTFPVSQREFLQMQQTRRQRRSIKASRSRLRFADGSVYDQTGAINFVDVTRRSHHRHLIVRATIPNPEGRADRRPVGARRARRPASRRKRSSCRRRR